MARLQNKKKTVRFTDVQDEWINEFCERNHVTFQKLINGFLTAKGMPGVDVPGEKDEIEQLTLFN